MITEDNLKHSPLAEAHRSLKARMIPFGGWEMPVQYEGIMAEYESTRQQATVFDISHMGEFIVEGDCVQSGLDRIITPSLQDMPEKTCRYGAMLNDQGGIIDDLIVFRIEKEEWMIVVNGATTTKDAQQFQQHITADGQFTDISSQIGKLDVQGPLSRDVLAPFVKGIEKLDYYAFDEFNVLGDDVIVSRTGYTGELGYEIYFSWDRTEELWNELLKNDKVKPAGLGARDVLRIEMGYSLYGHELSEEITPLESGLERFVNFDKDFIGKEALKQKKGEGIKRKVVCLASENRRSPRHDQKIYSSEKKEIGIVTSGTFSPSLKVGIGLGYVDVDYKEKGQEIYFGNQDNQFKAAIAGRPFYKNGSLKN